MSLTEQDISIHIACGYANHSCNICHEQFSSTEQVVVLEFHRSPYRSRYSYHLYCVSQYYKTITALFNILDSFMEKNRALITASML